LVSITVEVPEDRVEEVRRFAAELRDELRDVVLIFRERPSAIVRAELRDQGLRYSSGYWRGSVTPDGFRKALRIARDNDADVSAEPPAQPRRPVLQKETGLPLSRLEWIRQTKPYSVMEAVEAVEQVFRKYAPHDKLDLKRARKFAAEYNSRVRNLFVLSKLKPVALPQKATMVAALHLMKRVDSKDSSLFTSAEARRFFEDINYRSAPIILDDSDGLQLDDKFDDPSD
jgi:hypothetical protein